MFPDRLLERNHAWASGRDAEPLPPVEAVRLAVVTCYDPRLDPLLRPALGLEEGQGFLFRAAGARVTATGGTLRSLAMAVFMFDVSEILVLGHSSCRMASFDTSAFIDAFRARGVAREAFGEQDLRSWAGALASPRQGVIESVAAIAAAPFLPRDLKLAGAVLDDTTGRIDVVLRPGDPLPGRLPGKPVDATVENLFSDALEGREGVTLPPLPRAAIPAAPAVRTVAEALGALSSQGHRLGQLHDQLRKESRPLRQLRLIQDFIKGTDLETAKLRAAFHELQQDMTADSLPLVVEALLPLLREGKR